MSPDAWILISLLMILSVTGLAMFSRILMGMMALHSEERKEDNEANRRVIRSLESAIREASGTTNIFHADAQVGDKQNVFDGSVGQIGRNKSELANDK